MSVSHTLCTNTHTHTQCEVEMKHRCQLGEMAAVTLITQLRQTQSLSPLSSLWLFLSLETYLSSRCSFATFFLKEKKSDVWTRRCFVTSERRSWQISALRLYLSQQSESDYCCCTVECLYIVESDEVSASPAWYVKIIILFMRNFHTSKQHWSCTAAILSNSQTSAGKFRVEWYVKVFTHLCLFSRYTHTGVCAAPVKTGWTAVWCYLRLWRRQMKDASSHSFLQNEQVGVTYAIKLSCRLLSSTALMCERWKSVPEADILNGTFWRRQSHQIK